MQSEEEVIRDILMRRSRAIEILYDRHAPFLLGICLRYCGNRPDAEDVLHDSFIKIMKKLHTFKPRNNGSFTGWMRTIVVNTALNYIRERTKWKKYPLINDQAVIEDVQEDEEGSLEQFFPDITREQVMEMICRLPLGYRTVFNLYVFEEFRHKEIAKMLSISENTSKSQLSKARTMLKKQIIELVNKEQTIS